MHRRRMIRLLCGIDVSAVASHVAAVAGRGSAVAGGRVTPATAGPAIPRPCGSGGTTMTIRNPVVWTWDQVKQAAISLDEAGHRDAGETARSARLRVRRIGVADIRYALSKGIEDFNSDPTHYLFLCALYPVVGLILARFASGAGVMQFVYPLAAGFALLGPLAGI